MEEGDGGKYFGCTGTYRDVGRGTIRGNNDVTGPNGGTSLKDPIACLFEISLTGSSGARRLNGLDIVLGGSIGS